MEKYKILERKLNGGIQKIYEFKNGYGASVVRHIGSYGSQLGLWELAVVIINDYNNGNPIFDLCYDTPITDDVIGYLTEKEVLKLLKKIKKIKE